MISVDGTHFSLRLDQISKSFDEICVLNSVSFQVQGGEIVALVGENGAGKSTLMKILSGVWPHGSYTGSIYLGGQELKLLSPKMALAKGISIIHQELNLIPELSIAENMFLTREPHHWGLIDFNGLNHQAANILQKFNLNLDPKTPVKELSIGQKQLIEIMKALTCHSKILILDEPTSALNQTEISQLFKILKQLKAQGVLCLYISHKLDEIFKLCDRVIVLRDGKLVHTALTHEISEAGIISAMVGRELKALVPNRHPKIGNKILEVSDLTCRNKKGNKILSNINLTLHRGEILGLTGLMGAGRTEFILTLFGASGFQIQGDIRLEGKPTHIFSPQDAIRNGIALLTEDRKLSGIIPLRSLEENITLSSLKKISSHHIVDLDQEKTIVDRFVQQFKIKAPHPKILIRQLSGGNQQKALLARWLMTHPKVLLLDEPTRGVDVCAKAEIYELIQELAHDGVAILLVSSELNEILNLSHRICVFNQGRVVQTFSREEASQEKIMDSATQSLEKAA